MSAWPLLIILALGACAGAGAPPQRAAHLLVREVVQDDRLFRIDWRMDQISATLIDAAARPDGRALIHLGREAIERTSGCTVVDARLPVGSRTVVAVIDCAAPPGEAA
ncbi:MAG: hypothetical protein ACI9ZH_001387 [Paracoccaceae bacterium]|jgi:hypothetical protein